ncbi:multiple sugar transport system ATP-binding protein [Devosia enhydra]|uniref:Multiple sugar transport system ATP-binding protein n=1 Tax=Devosia enhydra TaxID=665118 RepID=A0A1K2HXZ9_9HYPH|nr:sn-glycerol-3-phosphate ABC transporter ATP-binding protein UgpC [Devosia enhydra]SFZ84633.1 multiple sugar transport system ATP-binding protein [Devosia enhydra]
MSSVVYNQVSKFYADGTKAVDALDLQIAEGEFMVIVGPSGCGKTTALRMAAGLEDISSGELSIGGKVVNALEPRDRDIAMVFQNYALYPHMSVFENIAFPLENQKLSREEIRKRVEGAAAILGLEEHLGRRPKNLSGGQRQRVAMGRAIVRRPKAFLMDEPLSNLDAKLRVQMRAEITRLQRQLGVTTLYVTHDQVEAMTMGHRIAVMRKGVLQQVGTPLELYERPSNIFVAAFVGSPAMNLLPATLAATADGLALVIAGQSLALPAALVMRLGLARYRDRQVIAGIRPEHLVPPGEGAATLPALRLEIVGSELIPPEQLVQLELWTEPLRTPSALDIVRDVDPVAAADLPRGSSTQPLVARCSSDRAFANGTADWGVVLEKLHLFDFETGKALGLSDSASAGGHGR